VRRVPHAKPPSGKKTPISLFGSLGIGVMIAVKYNSEFRKQRIERQKFVLSPIRCSTVGGSSQMNQIFAA
jgi:hypothetical protein